MVSFLGAPPLPWRTPPPPFPTGTGRRRGRRGSEAIDGHRVPRAVVGPLAPPAGERRRAQGWVVVKGVDKEPHPPSAKDGTPREKACFLRMLSPSYLDNSELKVFNESLVYCIGRVFLFFKPNPCRLKGGLDPSPLLLFSAVFGTLPWPAPSIGSIAPDPSAATGLLIDPITPSNAARPLPTASRSTVIIVITITITIPRSFTTKTHAPSTTLLTHTSGHRATAINSVAPHTDPGPFSSGRPTPKPHTSSARVSIIAKPSTTSLWCVGCCLVLCLIKDINGQAGVRCVCVCLGVFFHFHVFLCVWVYAFLWVVYHRNEVNILVFQFPLLLFFCASIWQIFVAMSYFHSLFGKLSSYFPTHRCLVIDPLFRGRRHPYHSGVLVRNI